MYNSCLTICHPFSVFIMPRPLAGKGREQNDRNKKRRGRLTLRVLRSNSSTADGSYDAKSPTPAPLDYRSAPASWPVALWRLALFSELPLSVTHMKHTCQQHTFPDPHSFIRKRKGNIVYTHGY